LSVLPPREYVPLAGILYCANRHDTRLTTAVFIAAEGSVLENVPISETPIVSWLTLSLPECAARTGLSMPPARPSKICPYLSTRKL
jgi:hypothetical protein